MKLDHRVRMSQRMIRRAFLDLLKKKPVQNITVKEVCEEAGIHRGHFLCSIIKICTIFCTRSKTSDQKSGKCFRAFALLCQYGSSADHYRSVSASTGKCRSLFCHFGKSRRRRVCSQASGDWTRTLRQSLFQILSECQPF